MTYSTVSVALVLIIPILSCRFLLRLSSILGYERPVFGDITLGSREFNFHCHWSLSLTNSLLGTWTITWQLWFLKIKRHLQSHDCATPPHWSSVFYLDFSINAGISLLLFGLWYLLVRSIIKKIYTDKISTKIYDSIIIFSSCWWYILIVVWINLCFYGCA